MFKERAVEMPLHDVAGENEKDDVDIRSLVVSEPDEAVVDQNCVVFAELERPVPVALHQLEGKVRREIALNLHFLGRWSFQVSLVCFHPQHVA